jgi:D-lactate dehydrogenase
LDKQVDFSEDPAVYNLLWKIRKDTFPAVGAVRQTGTTVIIEDVTFPIEQLAEGVNRLLELFDKHGYAEAIIFGHALEGNLHFVFTQGFDSEAEKARYAAFMQDVAQLVAVEFGGALKAEHGTGRNMAPFVELEWGHDAYQLMWQIKRLLDPQGILNPDVVLSNDPQLHLKNLKPLPAADEIIDKCIECGFCEPVCPSKGLTLSPRQRIVIWRDIQAKKRAGIIRASWKQPISTKASTPAPPPACAPNAARWASTPAIWCANCVAATPPARAVPTGWRITFTAPYKVPASCCMSPTAHACSWVHRCWAVHLPQSAKPARAASRNGPQPCHNRCSAYNCLQPATMRGHAWCIWLPACPAPWGRQPPMRSKCHCSIKPAHCWKKAVSRWFSRRVWTASAAASRSPPRATATRPNARNKS